MKSLLTAILLTFSVSAMGQALIVNVFEPLPGGAQQTAAYAQEAKAIHEAMGAGVTIGMTVDGKMHYGVAQDSWASYGRWAQSLAANSDWQAFQRKINADPSAVQTDNHILYTVAAGENVGAGGVYQVYIWEPNEGKVGQLMQGGIGAKPIHEKVGAKVTVLRDELNRMHYVMMFDSWEAWGQFQDTPNPEFNAYMQERTAEAAGRLIEVYTATVQP